MGGKLVKQSYGIDNQKIKVAGASHTTSEGSMCRQEKKYQLAGRSAFQLDFRQDNIAVCLGTVATRFCPQNKLLLGCINWVVVLVSFYCLVTTKSHLERGNLN